MREAQVRSMVRRVVYRTLGKSQPSPDSPASYAKKPVVKPATDSQPNRLQPKSATELRIKRLVSESDVASVERDGVLEIQAGALVTPLARQAALERSVELRSHSTKNGGESSGMRRSSAPASQEIVAIGADHGGYELKESLKHSLIEWGYELVDCGTVGAESVDYPDYALAVAQMVANGSAWLGVMIDGAGIGSCMTANKVPGVRASMCYDQATAVNSREHNNANLLTLGAGLIGGGLARSILKTWLETPFAGGRHAKRVDKIGDIERRYLRSAVPA